MVAKGNIRAALSCRMQGGVSPNSPWIVGRRDTMKAVCSPSKWRVVEDQSGIYPSQQTHISRANRRTETSRCLSPRYSSIRKTRMVPPGLSFPFSSIPLFDGVTRYFPSRQKATAPTPNMDT